MEKLKKIMVLFLIASCFVACKPGPDPEPDPVIEKTYVVGNYYEKDGVKGIVYKISADKKHGMIVAMDEASHAWAVTGHSENRTGAQSTTDGMANMNIIKQSTINNYPAFAFCNDKNKGGVTGWYLPAYEELIEFRSAYSAVKDSLAAHGGTAFSDGAYWSSSENDNLNPPYLTAIGVSITTNNVSPTLNKTEIHAVRAIRAF